MTCICSSFGAAQEIYYFFICETFLLAELIRTVLIVIILYKLIYTYLNRSLKAINLSTSGYDCPASHFATACLDTPIFSASFSWDIPFLFSVSAICSGTSFLPPLFYNTKTTIPILPINNNKADNYQLQLLFIRRITGSLKMPALLISHLCISVLSRNVPASAFYF